jgi:hypothetical protein
MQNPGTMQNPRLVPYSIIACVFLALALLPSCASNQAPPALEPQAAPPETSDSGEPITPVGAVVESWDTLAVVEFNSRIEEAAGQGETWMDDPVEMVDRFIWGGIGGRHIWLEMQGNRLEGPDSTVITLVRDGFADDSIRGDWHKIVLYKLPDGSWRLAEARRAFRCYRGHQKNSYGRRLCL